jgi:putative Holliday junction resolvase
MTNNSKQSPSKNKAQTVLGFDFGKKYIGIAIGQQLTGSASPLGSVKAKDGIPQWDNIKKYIDEWQPDLLVVGLPLNMDGSEQQITLDTRKFAKRLQGKFGKPIVLQDERLTTAAAKSELFDQGGFRNLSKDNIDAQSAKLIIESYFEQQYGQ